MAAPLAMNVNHDRPIGKDRSCAAGSETKGMVDLPSVCTRRSANRWLKFQVSRQLFTDLPEQKCFPSSPCAWPLEYSRP